MAPDRAHHGLNSISDLLLKEGLYKSFPDPRDHVYSSFAAVELFRGTLDTFCPKCGQQSVFARIDADTFAPTTNRLPGTDAGKTPRVCHLVFRCAREANHKMHLFFEVRADSVTKIGQSPSLADLASEEIASYRKVIPAALVAELNRAIGLAAHGVGVGSFVYLRRIFEKIIAMAHSRARARAGWDEIAYSELSRIDEKIRALRDELPTFLVQNKLIYGVLSKGVHELSEDECLDAFPPVRAAIEIVLDQEVEMQARRKKESAAQKALQALPRSRPEDA